MYVDEPKLVRMCLEKDFEEKLNQYNKDLDIKLQEKLKKAIENAFSSSSELDDVLYYSVAKNSADITKDGSYPSVVRQVICWCLSQQKLGTFLKKAREENSGNTNLKTICEKLYKIQNKTNEPTNKRKFDLLDQCKFDLRNLLENCLDVIRDETDENRILGIGVPCEEEAFTISLCTRIKNTCTKKITYLNSPITLSSTIGENDSSRIIGKIKSQNKKGDVILVRMLVRCSHDKLKCIWDEISKYFKQYTKNHVIIMMFCEKNIFENISDNIKPMKSPEIKGGDIEVWIQDVVKDGSDGFKFVSEDIQTQFINSFIDNCKEDDNPKLLKISEVYFYLQSTICNLMKLADQKEHCLSQAFIEEIFY